MVIIFILLRDPYVYLSKIISLKKKIVLLQYRIPFKEDMKEKNSFKCVDT